MHFDRGRTTMEKDAISVSLERRVADRVTLSLGGGAQIHGVLQENGRTHDLLPGPMLSLSGSWLALLETSARPFVMLSGSLGASVASTRARDEHAPAVRLVGTDLRVGVAVGKTFGPITPYVLARAFDLPAIWRIDGQTTTGGDAYHYQLGLGAVLRAGREDISLELVPLGEGAVTLGAGLAF